MVAMACEMLRGRHRTFGAARQRLAHPWLLVVLLGVVAAGCSATGSNAPTSTRPQIPNLRAMLVTARELPPGYSAAPTDSGIPPCNFQQVLTEGAVGKTQVSFASDSTGVLVAFTELLVAQPAERVDAQYSRTVARLKGCRRFDTGESGLGTMTGQPITLPRVGESSAAFRFVVSVGGVGVPQYLVVARFGSVVAAFTGIGGNTAEFERLIKVASADLAKVR